MFWYVLPDEKVKTPAEGNSGGGGFRLHLLCVMLPVESLPLSCGGTSPTQTLELMLMLL